MPSENDSFKFLDEFNSRQPMNLVSASRESCDHVGDWVHDYDPSSRLGDAYYCSKCGALMQVG